MYIFPRLVCPRTEGVCFRRPNAREGKKICQFRRLGRFLDRFFDRFRIDRFLLLVFLGDDP